MSRHGLGALLLMYDENMRYVSSTYTPGWNRLKPGLRYVVLCEGNEPIVYEQGDIGIHLKAHNPWIPPQNVRHSYSWIKGAAGPASQSQVAKFVTALVNDLEEAGVLDKPLGVDFIDINMIQAFQHAGVTWTDGMTPMMEARSVKSPDEQKASRIVGAICDALHYEFTQFLRPGLTENEVAAFGFEYLYNIPGMEDVEDIIVSSGPNAWPNWRNFSDRIIRPGELVIIDLAALTWNGFKSCVYRTYCVGGTPTSEMKRYYDTAHTWLWDAIDVVRPGVTTRDIAAKWPSARGGLGVRGRGPGRGQPLGPRAGPGPVRPAGHLPDLVAGLPGGDQAGHGLRAGDAAREGARLRRAAGGDAAGHRRRPRTAVVVQVRRDHRGRMNARRALLPLGELPLA